MDSPSPVFALLYYIQQKMFFRAIVFLYSPCPNLKGMRSCTSSEGSQSVRIVVPCALHKDAFLSERRFVSSGLPSSFPFMWGSLRLAPIIPYDCDIKHTCLKKINAHAQYRPLTKRRPSTFTTCSWKGQVDWTLMVSACLYISQSFIFYYLISCSLNLYVE